MIDSHEIIKVTKFKGDYSRDRGLDCPFDHFQSSQNLVFTNNGVKTRDGASLSVNLAVVKAFLFPTSDGVSTRWIILTAGGNFYDSTSLGAPILTLAGVDDFAMIAMYGRAYIAPRITGNVFYDASLYVYSGSGTARKAAGFKPSTSLTAATSATAGNVESGIHLISYAYETDSGFITKSATSVAYTAPGAFKIDLSAVANGPTGTAKKHILATKRIVNYTGNPDDYELFFVPSATISDNTTTIITINFFDSQLVDSADYLLDQKSEIPAFYSLVDYEGSLIGIKSPIVAYFDSLTVPPFAYIWASKFNNPESFSDVDGFLPIDAGNNAAPNTAAVLNKILYVFKDDRTYAVQGDLSTSIDALPPAQWPMVCVSSSLGCPSVNGIAKVLDTQGAGQDYLVVATKSGLWAFNGSYSEQPLSWKIQTTWNSINWALSNQLQSINDPIKKHIYFLVGYTGESAPSRVLVFNYQDGLNLNDIKITSWIFPQSPTCIGLTVSSTTKFPEFNYGSSAGLFKENLGVYHDGSATAIDSKFITGYFRDPEGGISHFSRLRVTLLGAGSLLVSAGDYTTSYTLPPVTLSTGPTGMQESRFNMMHEAIDFQFRINTVDKYFEFVMPLYVFVKRLWATRNG